ncbi:hypothetical protein [Planococcus lenghuensis]|uniref:Uncharacterized protein n=1 Tax=Planococcus lenghuensis TaxID=2213202 RepID=A0A1Q2KUI5_9BACL|nr:hypothetical protein [Planococcus lenghuensis]AQQ51870.1 hypothetical protein B0X71_01205 [Planococcus lenghuensis]
MNEKSNQDVSKNKKKVIKDGKEIWVYEDHDMHNSVKADQKEAPDADKVEGKEGLTELDATYYDEWQSMEYPRTNKEIDGLDELADDDEDMKDKKK